VRSTTRKFCHFCCGHRRRRRRKTKNSRHTQGRGATDGALRRRPAAHCALRDLLGALVGFSFFNCDCTLPVLLYQPPRLTTTPPAMRSDKTIL